MGDKTHDKLGRDMFPNVHPFSIYALHTHLDQIYFELLILLEQLYSNATDNDQKK